MQAYLGNLRATNPKANERVERKQKHPLPSIQTASIQTTSKEIGSWIQTASRQSGVRQTGCRQTGSRQTGSRPTRPGEPKMAKYVKMHWFYRCFGRPLWSHIRPPSEQEKKSTIQKRAPRCMRALRRQKKRAPRCMGALRPKNGRQKRVPKKRSKAFKINAFRCFLGDGFFEVTPHDLSATLHGNAIFGKNVKNALVLPLAPRSRRGHAEEAPRAIRLPSAPAPPDPLVN